MTGLPSFGRFTDHGDGTATVVFAPGFSDGGRYELTVTVQDPGGLYDREVVLLEVEEVNRAPMILVAATPTVTTDGQLVTLDGSGSLDPDNDPVTYQWTPVEVPVGGPSVDLTNSTGVLASFQAPLVSAATTLKFELAVRDGRGGETRGAVSVAIHPRGDTDGDGRLTHVDVATLLKGLAGIGSARVPASTDPRFPAWDFNRDGQVNQEDATGPTGLMQRLLGRNP